MNCFRWYYKSKWLIITGFPGTLLGYTLIVVQSIEYVTSHPARDVNKAHNVRLTFDSKVSSKPGVASILRQVGSLVLSKFAIPTRILPPTIMADHFELANYSVCESASTTLTIYNFMKSYYLLESQTGFISTSKSANEFYATIYPRGFANVEKEYVYLHLGIVKSDRSQFLVNYNVSIIDVNGEKQRTRGDYFWVLLFGIKFVLIILLFIV